jgi:hypothetical protein
MSAVLWSSLLHAACDQQAILGTQQRNETTGMDGGTHDAATNTQSVAAACAYAAAGSNWCWENPLPQSNTLYAVSGVSATDAWAVGAAGTALHYDGTTWKRYATPTVQSITSLSVVASDDVWAAAADYVLHWNGQTWSTVGATHLPLTPSVWGESATSAWAIDLGSFTHYVGTTSTSITLPSGVQPTGIWGTSATDIWLADGGGTNSAGQIWHYDGANFTQSYGPTTGTPMTSLWGSSSTDVWAAGWDQSALVASIAHYTNGAWHNVEIPSGAIEPFTTTSFAPVAGSGPNDVWFGGSLHYDGTALVLAPTSPGTLDAVWPEGGGAAIGGGVSGQIDLYNGTSWTTSSVGSTASLSAVWASAENDVWAAGGSSTLHYDGTAWEVVTDATLNAGTVLGVVGTAANDVWFYGMNENTTGGNDLIHYDGTSYTRIDTNITQLPVYVIEGAIAFAKNDVWFIAQGVVVHYDGTTFTAQQTPSTGNAIWGSSSHDLWTSGGGSTIAHYDGTTWSLATAPVLTSAANSFGTVSGSGANDVWAVGATGNAGLVAHYDGTTWTQLGIQTTTASLTLAAGVERTAGDFWAVGESGSVVRCTTSGCAAYSSGANADDADLITGAAATLNAIVTLPSGRLIAVGSNGTILHLQP